MPFEAQSTQIYYIFLKSHINSMEWLFKWLVSEKSQNVLLEDIHFINVLSIHLLLVFPFQIIKLYTSIQKIITEWYTKILLLNQN